MIENEEVPADSPKTSVSRTRRSGSATAHIRAKYPKAYYPWSPDEETSLREHFREGQTTSALAEYFGRKPGAIRSRLIKLGLIAYNTDTGRYEAQ